MTYNYPRFKTEFYDLASFDGPHRGEQMPDWELTDLDGNTVSLSDLWDRAVVLETGSITCPMYAKGVDRMADLAAKHPETHFVVLYVREAHPGERVGPHESHSEKAERAAGLQDAFGERRTVLIDEVGGTAHQALGSLPNMVYVLDQGGTVRFRGDWNDPSAVEAVLAGTGDGNLLAREHFPPAKPSPRVALTTLFRGGVAAILDFFVGLPALMASHRRADRKYETTT